MTTTIRVSGGIHDRTQPGWVQDPDNASKGTYDTEPVYITGPADAPSLAVIQHGQKLFTVVHVNTGLAVPAGFPGVSAAPKLYPRSLTQFRLKTAARAYMDAVAATDILPADRTPTRDELLALRDWLAETHPIQRR